MSSMEEDGLPPPADVEDGEIEDDSDHDSEGYTPLPRPERETPASVGPSLGGMLGAPRPRSSTNSSTMANAGDDDPPGESPALSPRSQAIDSSDSDLFTTSSEDDSSTDGRSGLRLGAGPASKPDVPRPKKKRRRQRAPGSLDDRLMDQGQGGAEFQRMVTQFQADRARRGLPTRPGGQANNVWGSLLQEESLNAELNHIGVGRRSLRDLDSDRGSETYDYVMAQKIAASQGGARSALARPERASLDQDLADYWDRPRRGAEDTPAGGDAQAGMETDAHDERRQGAIRAGKKRSVKERLGSQPHRGGGRGGSYDREVDEDLSIPQPGVPRTIADLTVEAIQGGHHAQLGQEISHKLSEPKTELMIGVVDIVGKEVALELFQATQKIEADGGLMIKNGARRRTPGGLFLHLLRDLAAKDSRVDESKVRHFFAQSNQRVVPGQKKRSRLERYRGGEGDASFESELASFKKLSQLKKVTKDSEMESSSPPAEGTSDLKPLPDILSCISQKFGQADRRGGECPAGSSKVPAPFVEPEAPPNSVERVLNTYEDDADDFLYADTENIELF